MKSLLSLTALAFAVSTSAMANESAVSVLKKEAVSNINSMIQNQKDTVVTDKNMVVEKATDKVTSVKDSAKEKMNSVKDKVKSSTSSDSSIKDKATEKLNSVKEKATTAKGKIASNAKVNINKADASMLQKLSGIGEKKAQAIMDYRNKVGKIKSVAELSKIDGLGDTTIEKIAPYLTF